MRTDAGSSSGRSGPQELPIDRRRLRELLNEITVETFDFVRECNAERVRVMSAAHTVAVANGPTTFR